MRTINPIQSTFNKALASGLLRDTRAPYGFDSISVYVPFSVFGVPVVGGQYYMPANPLLNGNRGTIKAMEIMDSATATPTPSNPGPAADCLTTDILADGMFYFTDIDREIIAYVPLATLVRRNNNGKIPLFQMTRQHWENCYIDFFRVSSLAASNGIWLNVYYTPNI